MYKYTVQIANRIFAKDDREAICDLLKRMGVSRVLLPMGCYHFDEELRKEECALLRDNAAFLKARGFEVGTWLWTFMDARENSDFVRMVLPSGKISMQSVCPSDPSFRAFAAEYICELAGCGVDLILYDDDFRYGNLAGEMGCVCENHLRFMSELLGEELTVDGVRDYLISGGENKYRTAWQKSKRYYFELFAKEMREALDKEYPDVRLGVCSCYPNWDHDGITTYEICKLLAGDNTKPLLRLTGAPFWALPNAQLANHRLQDTIDTARMARSFCESDTDAEIIGEGDTYPRPRFMGPANHLEAYDQILRAEGRVSGLLKYTFDGYSTYKYEMGYNRRHLANMPIYERIDRMFGGKKTVGVRVYEHLNKYEKMDIPASMTQRELQYTFFSWAARTLTAAQVPIVFEGDEGVAVVYGENAKYLTKKDMGRGLILDARAAEILTERGFDVGLVKRGEQVGVSSENFVLSGQTVGLMSSRAYKLTLRDGAEIQSTFFSTESVSWQQGAHGENIVGSYFYENKDGGKFLVFAFDGTLAHNTIFRHYERADQIKATLSRLGSAPQFCVCTSPDLYALAKEGEGRIAVGLWNLHADPVDEPFIRIEGGKSARIVSVINCEAVCDGEVIRLSPISPYGFAAVEFETV